jgi:hypothetical protein
MAEYTQESLVFDSIAGINCNSYGFNICGDKIVFSVYKATSDNKWRDFIKANFIDIAKINYAAMKFDAVLPKSRKRKLSTFLKSIYDQDNELVSLLMVKAIRYLIDSYGETDINEDDLINKVISEILPQAGFIKIVNEKGRYVWVVNDGKKFKKSIGKAFVLNYINNNFDKDSVWKWIKKYCFLKDGIWNYKNYQSKEKLLETVKTYIKNGGILVEENFNKEFEFFVPLKNIGKDIDKGSKCFILEKAIGESKSLFTTGIAATTHVDRDEERFSEEFIAKMQSSAVGLPLFVNSHSPKSLDDTVGVIVKSGGDKNNLEIEAKLESPDNNDNVKKVINKMDMGIPYGYSVGGRVTKAYREFDKKIGKEVVVLADGQLHHILLTNQPANPNTMAEAVAKSMKSASPELRKSTADLSTIYSIKHRSAIHKDEPSEDVVLKSVATLPDTAFPIDHKSFEVDKNYVHHFVDADQLYLHKSLLLKAYRKALSKNAPKYVISHLKTHMSMIGLQEISDSMDIIIKSVENNEEVENMTINLGKEIKNLVNAVMTVKPLKASKMEKLNMVKDVLDDVSTKITNMLESVEIEE